MYSVCMHVCVWDVCTYVCLRRQVVAAFVRAFRKGLCEEVAFNLVSSRQPCGDLGKGI